MLSDSFDLCNGRRFCGYFLTLDRCGLDWALLDNAIVENHWHLSVRSMFCDEIIYDLPTSNRLSIICLMHIPNVRN